MTVGQNPDLLVIQTGPVRQPPIGIDRYGHGPDARFTLNLYWLARATGGELEAADDGSELCWFERICMYPLSILTPHDGEYARLMGRAPGPDRVAAARELAAIARATVVLKGATPVVADREGEAFVVTSGDARLATAGTGDVLSGIIGGLLALGVHPLRAAAAGAWLHGTASSLGPSRGFVAGELLDTLPFVLDDLER